MLRVIVLILMSVFLLGACAAPAVTLGTDGKPLPRVYKISASDSGPIQFRVLDSVNALRQAAGAPPIELNAQLNAAAATHSRDMSVQTEPCVCL